MASAGSAFLLRLAFVSLLLLPVAVWGAVSVECEAGCRPVTACAGNASPYLLCLADRGTDVKLTWRVDTHLSDGQSLQVYAGNPARAAGIPERNISFAAEDGALIGSFTFKQDELDGALLVVTTLKSRDGESILSWIPFRISTEAETQESVEGPDAAGNWSVDVTPAFIQVSAGWRELPRTRAPRTRTWFSLAADPVLATDADLDGNVSGVPGLVMQVSAPWHAREDWKTKVQEVLGIPSNHAVKFESLHWEEKPDRVIDIPGVGPISLRNYYTVVTLFTNASIASYTAREMGRSGSTKYYAHETSASLKQVDHPLLWASYSLNDYSADNRLLGLLQEHVEGNGPSLGLGPVQRVNGDGGPAVYRAAFTVRVRPWSDETTSTMRQPQAGIVGIDVLAVRAGMGGIKVPGANATGVQTESICNVWTCNTDDGLASIDFNKPPRGWDISPPRSSTLSLSSQIPLMDGVKSIAERSADARASATLPHFPANAQFALATSLQAGALVRRGGFLGRRVDGIVPINSYAQYVVRFAVATFPGQELVTTDTPVMPSPEQIDVVTVTPKKKSISDRLTDWVRDNFALAGIAVIAAFIALLLLVPGFRSLVSAFFGFLASIFRAITPKGKDKEN